MQMRNILLLKVLVLGSCNLLAQAHAASAAFNGACPTVGRSFKNWIARTQLKEGVPYLVDRKQKDRLFNQYPKIKLQMSLEDVEKLLGPPDFTLIIPTAHSANNPASAEPRCIYQITYVIEKHTDNMLDVRDLALYLSFSDNQLYWSSPLNLPNLKPLGVPIGVNPEQHVSSWKKYTFTDDEFSIDFPETPVPHPDVFLPDMTVYTVSMSPGVKLSVHVSRRKLDCTSTMAQIKDQALKGAQGILTSSVHDVSIDGFPGLEYKYQPSDEHISYDRYYCVEGKIYAFTSFWTGNESTPADILRIINSFRLINK